MLRLLQADLLVLPSQRKREQSEAALDAFYRGVRVQGRPLLFLDFDDVLCLNEPYGSQDVFQKDAERPIDLWERLWHPPAAQTLLSIVDEYRPYIVITTNWLRLMERDAFIALFERTGLRVIADLLHDVWDAPQDRGCTRYQAVEKWLREHYDGQLRQGDNPARWRGHLDQLLPAPGKVAKVEHHTAVAVADMPSFMLRLQQLPGIGARALAFAILTAARSGEVRGALRGEIDQINKTWTVPGDRMKAGREHRVPLSDAAWSLLPNPLPDAANALLFPAPRGGMLSDMTLTAVMRRMELKAVPHGFRSTFRDWCAEHTDVPREVAEMALAHAIGDKVEAAYRRGDLFGKRRNLMQLWATFCLGPWSQSMSSRA